MKPVIKRLTVFIECDDTPMTLTRQFSMVLGGYLTLAAPELLIHLILRWPHFRALQWVYLLRTSTGGMALFPDLIFPACLLGWWNGWVGRKASFARAAAFVLPLAAGIVGLFPVYALLVGQELIWSLPKGAIEAGLLFAKQFFSAALFVLFFTAASHKNTRH
jgi:hypothetical protein